MMPKHVLRSSVLAVAIFFGASIGAEGMGDAQVGVIAPGSIVPAASQTADDVRAVRQRIAAAVLDLADDRGL